MNDDIIGICSSVKKHILGIISHGFKECQKYNPAREGQNS